MATEVNWNIVQLERHLPDGDTCPEGAVYAVHWTASLEENGKSVNSYGSFGVGDPDPGDFTPFHQLTKEQVLDWTFSILGDEKVASIEGALRDQLQSTLTPTSTSGLPW